MRSLALKLTLAFLVVALTGAVLVAAIVRLQTQREFDRFVLDRYQIDLVQELSAFYRTTGSWDGVEQLFVRASQRHGNWPDHTRWPLALVDADRQVVLGGGPFRPGSTVETAALRQGAPIDVDGQTIGWLLFSAGTAPPGLPADSPESRFLADVSQATILSALAATAVALLVGALLARTISRPIHELTEATRIVAQGELGHQVPVRTQDEIGQLAGSFNQMSADLARANTLRRQMTADIAHDLRTPTSVILGYTEALSDGKLAGSPEMYRVMHQEAQHLNHLIEDLRTLTLADAGELTLLRRPVPPVELLDRTAAAHAIQAQQHGVRLDVAAPPELPPVNVDPDRMTQVLSNLVSNALRHTPAGGRVTLAAEPEATAVRLTVSDTGSGIDPADLPYIFNRFYRGDKSRSQNGESGLGLAIARSIVQAHGGTITADSTPGAGTTFAITLPLAAG